MYLLSQYPAVTHTYLLREVLELRRLGWNIHVISVRPPDRPLDTLQPTERDEAAQTYYVKRASVGSVIGTHCKLFLVHPTAWIRGLFYALRMSRQNPSKLLHNLFYFAEAVMVGCWMQRRNITHLHTHFVSTVALLVKKIFPFTLSMTIHGPEEFDDAVGFHLDEKMAAADFVVAISHYARSQLMRASAVEHWPKITVVPLGVDPSIYLPVTPPAQAEPFRLICVARLAPVKAQSILVQTVSRLALAGRRVELHLVGGGLDRERLEQSVKNENLEQSVVFHGPLPPARVAELLASAHAFVLASFAEGVPVALMEAMALEVPCIATNVMGVPELIRPGIEGILVPPSDIDGFTAAIGEFIDNPQLRERYGKWSRKRVVERYDIRRNIAAMSDILDSFFARNGPESKTERA